MSAFTPPRAATPGVRSPARALSVLLLVGFAGGCASASPGPVSMDAVRAHMAATSEANAGVHRWPAGSELVVDIAGLDAADSTTVVRAFGAWLDGSGVDLRIRLAGAGEAANVVIREVDRIEQPRDATGLTRVVWEGRSLVRARVEMNRFARSGDPIGPEERYRALLHEVGHVLGLGHSERSASVMHPHAATSRVDDTDRAALTFLYSLPLVPVGPAGTAGAVRPDG